MPYSSLPYSSTNLEVTNKELIAHMPSHPIIDNNQIMANPHGHLHGYSTAQDANLQAPPNSLANSNHLNSVVDSDAYSYSLSSIGAGYQTDQTAAAKKRKRDLPNEEDPLAWYDQQQQQSDGAQQDVKLIQQSQQYDGSTNNLYAPQELLQANNQLPPQQKQSIFNNSYAYMDPNEQWSNQTAANTHQQQIANNYHYDQTTNAQQQQSIGQLGAIGYMPEPPVYDGGLPPMSQLRPTNALPGGYLPADQSSFQSIDNGGAQLQHISQQQQQQGVIEQRDIDDAINILKEHAAEPNSFSQQQMSSMSHLTQLDPHVQSSANDVSGSMPSLSTNTVSTTSNLLDDKVGSSNVFMRQKMNSTSSLNLGKGNKRSRSSRK